MKKIALLLFVITSFLSGNAQITVYWKSDGYGSLWADADNNWYRTDDGWSVRRPDLATGQWVSDGTKAYSIVNFDNTKSPTTTVNGNNSGGTKFYVYQLLFKNSTDRTINSTDGGYLSLGGGSSNSKIEAITGTGTGTYTFNVPIVYEKNSELNPVGGNLTFNSTINNSGYWTDVWGTSGKTLTIAGVFSGTGGLSVKNNTKVLITSQCTYTGNTYIDGGGTIEIQQNQSSALITVESGSKLVVNGNLSINSLTINSGGTVEVVAGKQLTINGDLINSGNLNLLSSIAGTATLVCSGTISGSGTTKVEQYLSSYRSWYLSSPLSGSVTPVDNNSAVPALLQWYDETKGDPNGWTTATQMTAGKGYMLNPGTTSGASTLAFSGTLSNANVVVNLTRSSVLKAGFNLTGNPYPSHIVWTNDMAAGANLLSSIWYRTAVYDNGLSKNIYSFNTFNSAGSVSVPVEATPYIPPMQAFWVRIDDTHTTGQLTLTKDMCHHKDGNALKSPAVKNSENRVLRIKVGNDVVADETLVYFNANASNAYDAYDSPKMINGVSSVVPDMYTMVGNEELVINGMSTIPAEIPLYIKPNASTSGQFSLRATEVSNFEAGTQVYIKNNKTGVQQLVSDGSVYSFDITADPLLSIIIKAPGAVTGLDNPMNTFNVYANAKGQLTVVVPAVNDGDVARVYNSAGQCILNQSLTNSRTMLNKFFTAGVYVVKVNETIRKVVIE